MPDFGQEGSHRSFSSHLRAIALSPSLRPLRSLSARSHSFGNVSPALLFLILPIFELTRRPTLYVTVLYTVQYDTDGAVKAVITAAFQSNQQRRVVVFHTETGVGLTLFGVLIMMLGRPGVILFFDGALALENVRISLLIPLVSHTKPTHHIAD